MNKWIEGFSMPFRLMIALLRTVYLREIYNTLGTYYEIRHYRITPIG
jgi:hypothetical protein